MSHPILNVLKYGIRREFNFSLYVYVVEPAILVMHHSMRSHPAVTATLLDFLCRVSFCTIYEMYFLYFILMLNIVMFAHCLFMMQNCFTDHSKLLPFVSWQSACWDFFVSSSNIGKKSVTNFISSLWASKAWPRTENNGQGSIQGILPTTNNRR